VPALFGRRDAARTSLAEALAAVGRLEESTLANDLVTSGDADLVDGERVDARIAQAGSRLAASAQEVDGRMRSFEQYSSTVRDAMETAAARRAAAQKTLEQLADEQRRASEEMKVTLSAALSAMDVMQKQWDTAVSANAADLRELRSSVVEETSKSGTAVERLKSVQSELESQSRSLEGMASDRRTLAEEEALLRKRYTQLRQRRVAKEQGLKLPANLNELGSSLELSSSLALEEVAEKAAAEAEKAAVGLFRLLNNQMNKPDDDKPPGKQQ